MDAQGVGHDARRDDVIEDLVNEQRDEKDEQGVVQRVHAKEFEGLEERDQRQHRPVDGRTHVGDKTRKTRRQRQPNGITDSQQTQHHKIDRNGNEKNDDLPAQESVPDARQFLPEAA